GGARPHPLRGREVVGQVLVDVARLVALIGAQLRQRGDLEGGGPPWVARVGQRSDLADDRLRVARVQLAQGGEQGRQVAVDGVDGSVRGDRLVGGNGSRLVAAA